MSRSPAQAQHALSPPGHLGPMQPLENCRKFLEFLLLAAEFAIRIARNDRIGHGGHAATSSRAVGTCGKNNVEWIDEVNNLLPSVIQHLVQRNPAAQHPRDGMDFVSLNTEFGAGSDVAGAAMEIRQELIAAAAGRSHRAEGG